MGGQACTLTPLSGFDQSCMADLHNLYEDFPYMVEQVKSDIENNQSQLWKCEQFGQTIGWAITRIDTFCNRSEFVIVGAIGKAKGLCLIDTFLQGFEDIARAADCDAVRVHGTKKGLTRMYERNEYHLCEYVYQKEV